MLHLRSLALEQVKRSARLLAPDPRRNAGPQGAIPDRGRRLGWAPSTRQAGCDDKRWLVARRRLGIQHSFGFDAFCRAAPTQFDPLLLGCEHALHANCGNFSESPGELQAVTDYDFRTLSPLDFEAFVRDLFNAEHDCVLNTFTPGPDGGVDLRGHRDDWGQVVVQCKHTPDSTKSALVRAAEKEAAKWGGTDRPDVYFFATSATVTPDGETAISNALAPLTVHTDGIWHRGRLNAALARQPNVERTHFKLWLASTVALEQITNSGQWQRSEELLQVVQDRVRLYVMTPTYDAALKQLEDHNAVVITGPPGCGKSTTAEMLLLTAWKDGWTVVDVTSDIAEAWSRLQSLDEKVLFYYDDFLGQTDTAELAKNDIGKAPRRRPSPDGGCPLPNPGVASRRRTPRPPTVLQGPRSRSGDR